MTQPATNQSANPVLVEVLRKDVVESAHRGSAVVVDGSGKVVFSIGDPERLIYPRSSIKCFQALPIIESGAADAFNLDDRRLALACASHNAESIHVDTVHNWLQQLELDVEDLECGPSLPMYEEAKHQLLANGGEATRAHHNCSGKHCGMLMVSKQLGVDTRGYSNYQHACQQAWMRDFGEIIDLDVTALHWQRDGCGLPAVQLPAYNLALGFARYASVEKLKGARRNSVEHITRAISDYPEMVAGSGRCCTAVISETRGRVLVKTGAEGVFGGFIPGSGLGFVVKADDGATRASEVMTGALLSRLGVLDDAIQQALAPWFRPKIINSQGFQTGEIVAADTWQQM